jgi:hypothetical protein
VREAYLNEFWHYQRMCREEVEKIERRIADIMDNIMLDFFSFEASELKIFFLNHE